MQPRTTHRVG